MTIFKQELKSNKIQLIIWSLSIGLLVAICVLMYPDMKSQMNDVSDIFSSMGDFTAAFGMDQLNFGTLLGFYAVEGGNMLGIGGAFFAAIVVSIFTVALKSTANIETAQAAAAIPITIFFI